MKAPCKIGKGFPYSLPSVWSGADPGVQAISLQVTVNHPIVSKLPKPVWSWMRHCFMSCTVGVGAAGGMDMNNWVSSAYRWWEMPYELMSWPTGEVYQENRSGPRAEPWGTPVFRETKLDWDVPIATHWLQFER